MRTMNPRPVLHWLLLSLLAAGCTPRNTPSGSANAPSEGAVPTPARVIPATGDIPVGEFGGITGVTAGFGQATHNGMILAVEELNAKGGVKGRKIRHFFEDNESQKEKVRPVVTKLITQSNAVAILGEVASSRSIAATSVCEKYGVPMISPSSTNPAVTVRDNGQVREWIFRVCFTDRFQGEAAARFVREHLKLSKVAVFRNVKEDYSKGLADFFTSQFQGAGGTVVKDVSYSTGDTDFRAQLTSIKASRPEAVFVPGYYTEIGLIGRQAKELGITVPLVGGDGWDDPLTFANPRLDGYYFVNHFWVDSPDESARKFSSAYTKRFGSGPNALSALGYDAVMLLADAMNRSKSLNGPDLRDAIAATRNFKGITGAITIDDQHNAKKAATVLQIKDRKPRLVVRIQPE